MTTRKLITRCVVMIAACVLACSARAQTTCPVGNLWVNGNFEGSNFSCNNYCPTNTWSLTNAPWYGFSYFVCQPIPMLPVLPGVINEATIDHTLGTPYGHYFYLDPRNGTGNVMQISQVVNVPASVGYTFSAAFCSMIMPGVGNIGATVQLTVDGNPVSIPVTLSSTVLNNWMVITNNVPINFPFGGTHTIGIIVVNPQAAPGYDFAIDDIYFGNGSMRVNAGSDKTTCASVPVTLGGSPTAQYGASCSGTGYTYNWTPAVGLSSPNVPNPVLTQATPGTYFYTVTVTDMNGHTCSDQVMVQVQNCPTSCPAANLWVNGTFENTNVGSLCNIYNPINNMPYVYPYWGNRAFIYDIANGVFDPALNEPTAEHTLNTLGQGNYLYVNPAPNSAVTSQVEQQIKIMPGTYTFQAWVYNMTIFNPAILATKVELRVNGNSIPGSGAVSLNAFVSGWTLIQGTYVYAGSGPITVTASIVLHNPATAGCDIAIDDVSFGVGIITADAGPNAWVCPNIPYTIGGSPTADFGATCNGNYTYSWSPAVGLSSTTAANPTVTLAAGFQTYTVTVTDLNGQTCQDQVTISVYPACRTAGHGESEGESESAEEPTALAANEDVINVFPVPASDVVHITASHDRSLQVTVYNTMGQKVMEQKMSNKLDLNVASWAREVYYIHLVDEKNGQRTVKSIVIK